MIRLPIFAAFAFLLTLACLAGFQNLYLGRQRSFILSEAKAVQSLIEDRFKLYLRGAHGLKKMADEFWKQPVVTPVEFEEIGDAVISTYPEVLGANFVTPDGTIAMVHPAETNAKALGKKTRNHAALLMAYKAGNHGIWLSPPFPLLQGELGFVYYFPIAKAGILIGWYGIVFSQPVFLTHFLHNQKFQNFHLKVTDVETGLDYIATAPLPAHAPAHHIQSGTFKMLGRRISVYTWPKDLQLYSIEWLGLVLVALFIAGLSTATWKFFHQRRQGQRQINELDHLLRMIIHDTATSISIIKGYVELMKQDPQLVPVEKLARHVGFVVELVEQIKLVKKLSIPGTSWEFLPHPLLPLVLEASEVLNERLHEKNLTLSYLPEALSPIQLTINQNLFLHSVLLNVLGVAIKFSVSGGTIILEATREGNKLQIRICNPRIEGPMEKADELALLIAKQVTELHHGELVREQSPALGFRVVMIFSV